MSIELRDYQRDAVDQLRTGSILCGGVGSGKSRTALAYYYKENGGDLDSKNYVKMRNPKDLYIITTARKRDTLEWEDEFLPFLITTNPEVALYKNHKVVVDSWNNIGKYVDVQDAFFIFDEQRVVGYGAWVKAFLKITKRNDWILLSATPGDTWQDYIPVFIANGFYRTKKEFVEEHIVYDRFAKYPKIDRYLNTGRLIRLRDRILVNMEFNRPTVSHHEDVFVNYDKLLYREVTKNRWNPYTNKPIKNASELCLVWRQIVNSDESRQRTLLEIFEEHPKMIVFYNYDYELDILKGLYYGDSVDIAEWNGHKHQPIPRSDSWVYLVQYNAGAEGWNCITTDTIVFYSLNYSYKIMAQSAGRIDRLNTPYLDLYYYHLMTRSGIDLGIKRALNEKKSFNETRYVNKSAGWAKKEAEMPDKTIAELINRRRRQILVHSVIYYKMDDNLISDNQWAAWAKELDQLQSAYPEIAKKCVYAKEFADFDPSTGYNLPLDDAWANNKAKQLLAHRDDRLLDI